MRTSQEGFLPPEQGAPPVLSWCTSSQTLWSWHNFELEFLFFCLPVAFPKWETFVYTMLLDQNQKNLSQLQVLGVFWGIVWLCLKIHLRGHVFCLVLAWELGEGIFPWLFFELPGQMIFWWIKHLLIETLLRRGLIRGITGGCLDFQICSPSRYPKYSPALTMSLQLETFMLEGKRCKKSPGNVFQIFCQWK